MGVGVSITVYLFFEIRGHHGRWKIFFSLLILSESQSPRPGVQNPLIVTFFFFNFEK
jgi:hypothetical protein